MKRTRMLVVAAVAAALAAGCAGDMVQQVLAKPETAAQVMEAIAGNSGLAGQMVDRLLGADSTRTMLVERLFADPAAAEAVAGMVAKNQGMLDGVIGAAVRDSATREHVLALFKGIQMAAGR
uniref:Uncharacterized protein n=1 Tax=Eiseniibacteriota bacterium TaxID=2212470 RepID=A0A832I604_UNCEI